MFRWMTDVERGDWIGPRLGPFGGTVGSVVPRGFDAYARILHRAQSVGADWRWVRWADVATAAGTVVHPTAQWWKVAGRPTWHTSSSDGRWDGNDPQEGELDRLQLASLVEVLREVTVGAVTAAFWEGSGWQGGISVTLWRADADEWHSRSGPTEPDLPFDVIGGPTLALPARNHIVFAGSLDDVAALAAGTATADVEPFRPGSRTPSLLWPDERTWCVATEVDFDSTLVGGPRDLIDAIVENPILEAFEVGQDDSLSYDGDTVN